MKASFIGLGRMGQVLAARLLDAGVQLTVYNRSPAKCGELGARGARVAASVAEACAGGEPVFTMLADDNALRAVALGRDGLLAHMPKGAVHVAMGTHHIGTLREIAEEHRRAGHFLIAAPVLGRPAVAAAGKLGIIAAGPEAALTSVLPLFSVIGRRTFRAGEDPGSASLLKLCNNFVLASAIEAMGEAFALAERTGIEPTTLRDVLTDGLFGCLAYESYSKQIVERAWDTVNFSASLGLKDLELVLAAAEAAAMPLPLASLCRDRLLGAVANGNGERDWSVMTVEHARSAGLPWAQ